MVVKQTLPEMTKFMNYVTRVVYLGIILSCYSLREVGSVQYCWTGTEDDLSVWKNQSCVSGTTSLGNLLSIKRLPGHDDNNTHSSIPALESFNCMAFKQEETTEQGNGTSMKTYTVNYGCDFEHVCSGREMNEGINFQKDGKNGTLYCCNDTNNCNRHTMIQNIPYAHRCFKAFSDGNTKTIQLETCPSEETYCMVVTTHNSTIDEGYRLINQSYSCDVNNLCEEKDLTDTLDKACKSFKDPKTSLETEVCCCKEDACFTPDWVEDGTTHTVVNKGVQINGIQRTILIGIGIAIGLLVAVVVFIVAVRYRRLYKASQHSNVSDKVVYSAVLEGEDSRDDVNILPRARR